MAAELQADFAFYPNDLYILDVNASIVANYRALEWSTHTVQIFSNDYPIRFHAHNETNWPFDYYVVAPILPNSFIVLGELTKFVTMSQQRFTKIDLTSRTIVLSMIGAVNEVVEVHFMDQAIVLIVSRFLFLMLAATQE